ncbi:hypothetical protein IB265_34750 [Ensifer sp. ENS10]|uniref:hypothetical protein n=1 Tax=Ensifer sp. ENS10 TaxID=2769286 RepID=UPI001783788C|nr:hypothetical protein [Ensifer sp. ENS10]MBD9511911.1 hypothetical protein [Ensifer sp. ENS10]
MTTFVALKQLGDDGWVYLNPEQVSAIETANNGTTSRVRLAASDIYYEIELEPSEVWLKLSISTGR